jgi:hypothetical protein
VSLGERARLAAKAAIVREGVIETPSHRICNTLVRHNPALGIMGWSVR